MGGKVHSVDLEKWEIFIIINLELGYRPIELYKGFVREKYDLAGFCKTIAKRY